MKTSIKILTYFFVLILVCSITIGYSAFNANLKINAGAVVIPLVDYIRISDVTASNTRIDTITHTDNTVSFNLSLNNKNRNSSLYVTITNIGNVMYGIKSINSSYNFGNQIYNNNDLASPIINGDGTCDGASKIITLSFNSSNTLNASPNLTFEFKKMHKVSINGLNVVHSNYVFDEEDYVINNVYNIEPNNLDVMIGSAPTSNYSYNNNTITVYGVNDDLVINYTNPDIPDNPDEPPTPPPEEPVDNGFTRIVSAISTGNSNNASVSNIVCSDNGVNFALTLSKKQAKANLTVEIETTGNTAYGIKSITETFGSFKNQIYDNSVLGVPILNSDGTSDGATKSVNLEFTINVNHVDVGSMDVFFEFEKMYKVTLNGLNANHDDYIFNNTDLVLNNVYNLDLSKLEVLMGGISYPNYTYSNNTLTIYGVSNDLIINYNN